MAPPRTSLLDPCSVPPYNPSRPWIVQKFGGTSISKFIRSITSTIIPNHLVTNRIAVVCSARSSETKSLGKTNRLLKAAASALVPGSTEFIKTVQDIRLDHLNAVQDNISNATILRRVQNQINHDCNQLHIFLKAIQTIEEMSVKSKDAIMAVGERLSCRIVAGILEDHQIETQFVNLEAVIEAAFEPTALDQNFYDYLPRVFASALSDCGHRLPVVTGFFGPVPGGLLKSIGRGYTDLAAALLAVGLGAEELQIWKEVDGIFTADPRKVQGARLLDTITPEEASELTYYGSEVVHPFTMEQVIRAHIPIRIKNVMKPNGSGTIIFPSQNRMGCLTAKSTPWTWREPLMDNGSHCAEWTRRCPTAVTVKDNIWVLMVQSNQRSLSHGLLADVFGMLDRHGIVVDLISASEIGVSIAMEGRVVEEREMGLVLSGLGSLGKVEVRKGRSIVSVVGRAMKSLQGVSGRIFSTVGRAGVNVEMISQGVSETNISCVVAEGDALNALCALHREFFFSDETSEL
ncbi:aspartate kinase [Linnemannia elongata AG-77]|uniref:Aspartokinase n=1 Tax=Linnemannia elongata AG-77 TaxID=1314771 RepID=A0A197JRP9_9FUNG|nr:aspartate kinase [Linnemannia elongata AG-77]